MKNKIILSLIIILIFFCSIVFGLNSHKKLFNDSNESIQKNNQIKAIHELAKKGDVKVFIKFKENLSKKNEEQVNINQKILNLLEKEKVKYQFEDGFSATISEKNLENLENNSEIESITLIGTKHIFLQDSVPLINATRTKNLLQNGLNLTGLGQTVCILDTGVNYTHPDLGGCFGDNNASSSCKVNGGWDFVNNDNNPIDDHGHGTHVAGIVAASGNITGVASNAKIVSIKVCNAAGSCSDDDIVAGINWCVNNATIFNISVISISLGGEAYTSYCDNEPNATIFVNPLNSAISNNISVVVASGNDGYTNAISLPACIKNVTPVGSTNKADSTVSSFSNTWNNYSFSMIVAPGESINSTAGPTDSNCARNGAYMTCSGTSMSTPHVSGAIAIISQYLKATGQTKTPQEIESVLNNTGRRIDDSSNSGLNFSRINIYAAIISLDNQAPNITLIRPSNGNVSSLFNQTFRCNASDIALKNMVFYLWNSTSVYNQNSSNISGQSYSFETNLTTLPVENYKWNCLFTDENNNAVFASSNYSLIIGGPLTTLSYPANNQISTGNETFQCNATSAFNLTDVTFYLWNSTSLENTNLSNAAGLTNSTTFNYTFNHEDDYKWNCLFRNNNSNQYFASSNYSITYDITYPNITLLSPYPADETSSSTSKRFYYNISDNVGIRNCSLIINAAINLTNSSISNLSLTQNFTQTFTPGTYSWSINCTDLGNNIINSSTQSFTITAPLVSSSSGGGGGGGGGASASIYTPSTSEISVGYSKQLKKDDKIKFSLNKENHTITVNSITINSINLTIQSEPTKMNILVGQSVKLNITSDEYYDLFIKLDNIITGKANVTIKKINESINRNVLIKAFNNTEKTNDTNVTNTSNGKKGNNNYLKYSFYAGILVIGLIIVYIISIIIIQIKREKQKELRKMVKLR